MSGENIVGKALLEGQLVLLSPLLIGDGASAHENGEQDICVLRTGAGMPLLPGTSLIRRPVQHQGNHELAGMPLLPGTSLIGAMRELLAAQYPDKVADIFGELDKEQSTICASDITFPADSAITMRNGVSIDQNLGTAIPHKRYDYEALDRGAKALLPLRLEFTLRGIHTDDPSRFETASIREDILEVLAFLRDKLASGIHLGANTAKGFGHIQLRDARLGLFDFRDRAAAKAWFLRPRPTAADAPIQLAGSSSLALKNPADFIVTADFSLRSSILVRNYQVIDGHSIATMTRSGRDAVIPGTTIKGVLRHRAHVIAAACGRSGDWLDRLMGTADNKQAAASEAAEGRVKSRFIVDECYLSLAKDSGLIEREITRNRIDRFTGGTIDGSLFRTQPLYQSKPDKATVSLHFAIRSASAAKAGLALFLLKDLWQGQLPLGGEAGVGRGTLKGIHAKISYQGANYEINQNGQVIKGDPQKLEACAAALNDTAEKEANT